MKIFLKKLECSSKAYLRVKKGHAVINFIQIGLRIFGPDIMCGNGRSVKSYLANNRKKRARIIIIIIKITA